MRLASRLASAALLATLASTFAFAQNAPSANPPIGIAGAYNSAPPTCTSGQACWLQTDINGKLLSTASVSVSSFAPGGVYATLTATGSSADVALPAGIVVIAQNTGTTAVSCILAVGAGTATASKNIIQAASWLAFTVGANTHIACIDQSGSASNVVVITGGAGLPTGAGGGGGGGGAVTIADGADVTKGAIADAAATAGSTGTLSAKLRLMTTQLDNINTNVQSPVAAGTNLIGKVGIDQTTPGTTNAVSVQYGSTAAFADPCKTQTPTIKPFSITTATTTNIVTGTSAKKLYVCYLYMQTVAANNIAVISGTTGATCGANTAALVGGTTAANGLNNAANSGQAFGKGDSAVMQVLTNNDDICIITSAATPLAGLIKYVVQ